MAEQAAPNTGPSQEEQKPNDRDKQFDEILKGFDLNSLHFSDVSLDEELGTLSPLGDEGQSGFVDRLEASRNGSADSWVSYTQDRRQGPPRPEMSAEAEEAPANDNPEPDEPSEPAVPEGEPTTPEEWAAFEAEYGEYLAEQEAILNAQREESPHIFEVQEEEHYEEHLEGLSGAELEEAAQFHQAEMDAVFDHYAGISEAQPEQEQTAEASAEIEAMSEVFDSFAQEQGREAQAPEPTQQPQMER